MFSECDWTDSSQGGSHAMWAVPQTLQYVELIVGLLKKGYLFPISVVWETLIYAGGMYGDPS